MPEQFTVVFFFVGFGFRESLYVCGVTVKSTASHYSCLEHEQLDFTSEAITGSTCRTCHRSVNLDLGTLTNVGFDEIGWTEDDVMISLGISVYVSNRSAVVGEVYDLNIAVTLEETQEEIYATIMNLTVVDDRAAAGTVSTRNQTHCVLSC